MTIFFISDTHFGHTNILKFTKADGSKLRPWDDLEEMHEAMVQNWNSVVKPQDKVYHLGDVYMGGRPDMPLLERLNGHKRLVLGNHDGYDTSCYLKHFEHVYGSRQFDGFIFTHIPIHTDSLARWGHNVHGHLHANGVNDARYINVSVEQIDYTPISLDELKSRA